MSMNPFKQMDSDYQASLNNAYRTAQNLPYGGKTLPEGKYQCILNAFSLKPNTQYPDELNLSLGFEVTTGDQRGVSVYKFYNINPEINFDRLKTDLATLGVDLHDDITNLGEESTIDQILDLIVDITIKYKKREDGKGFFQNIYINRCHGKAESEFNEVIDDELPFD